MAGRLRPSCRGEREGVPGDTWCPDDGWLLMVGCLRSTTARRGDGTAPGDRCISRAVSRSSEAAVLDVGTGPGVPIPLIQSYRPSTVSAGDVAEKMLLRVHHKYLESVLTTPTSPPGRGLDQVDAIFMNVMYGNIADSLLLLIGAILKRAPAQRKRS